MSADFTALPFSPADILLPVNCEYAKWSVVACDQYTSQPEYWQRVGDYVRSAVVPAAHPARELSGGPRCGDRHYGREQHHDPVSPRGAVLRNCPTPWCTWSGRSGGGGPPGIVGMVDLEQYDYEPDPPPPSAPPRAPSCPASRPAWPCGRTPPSSCPTPCFLPTTGSGPWWALAAATGHMDVL